MALYMDVHNSLPDGTTAADVAGAHAADLRVQERHGVRYLNYWVDEKGGNVFCLIEAPQRRRRARGPPRGARPGRRRDLPRRAGVSAHEFDAGTRSSTSSTEAHEVAGAFLGALATRRFTAARALLADDVRLRMLLPSGFTTEADAVATIGRFVGWFGDADRFEVEASSAGEIEGRAVITYRLRLRDAGGWHVIEQHLMLDVDADGRVNAIDLLCSGFRSVATTETGRVHAFDAGDLGCADGLAGEFRRQMQQIPVGHVLMVSTNDPAAKEDLPPLARMMGHVVRSIEAPGDGRLLVSVEKGR